MVVSRRGASARAPRVSFKTMDSGGILIGDCVAEMAKLPAESVDLVFADPPYNLQLNGDLKRPDDSRVDAVDDDWDKFASFSAYDDFTRAWLIACRRVMKPAATLWVIGSYHNIFRVGAILQDLGFWILNDVVWRKSNPMPNFRGRRFTNAHETLIWAAREARRQGLYLQLRSAQGRQRRRADALGLDYRVVHRRGAAQRRRRQEAAPDPKARGAAGAGDSRRLAARRPRARPVLRHRHDRRGGQAARAAASSGSSARRPMPRPRERASQRSRRCAAPALAPFVTAREAPRVPFSALIERGLVVPGARLCDAKRKVRALVRADGAIALGATVGSIHRIGALAQGLEACNGWAFWHLETAQGLVSIDALRAEIRAEMDAL